MGGNEPADKPAGWFNGYWLDIFEERAAIREYDGGLSRTEAEAGAFDDLVMRWARLASRRDDPERIAALATSLRLTAIPSIDTPRYRA